MGGLEGRLRRLEVQVKPEASRNPEARARMKGVLDEIAAARCQGRAPSPEAASVAEAFEERGHRGH